MAQKQKRSAADLAAPLERLKGTAETIETAVAAPAKAQNGASS